MQTRLPVRAIADLPSKNILALGSPSDVMDNERRRALANDEPLQRLQAVTGSSSDVTAIAVILSDPVSLETIRL